jgi:hypothetical protein
LGQRIHLAPLLGHGKLAVVPVHGQVELALGPGQKRLEPGHVLAKGIDALA